jgi:hypothetical protein
VKITLTVKTGVKPPVGSAVPSQKLITPMALENQALPHGEGVHEHHGERKSSGDDSALSSRRPKIILKSPGTETVKRIREEEKSPSTKGIKGTKRIGEGDIVSPCTKRVKRGEDLESPCTPKTATKIVVKCRI